MSDRRSQTPLPLLSETNNPRTTTMQEPKDPAMKLFGKEISLSSSDATTSVEEGGGYEETADETGTKKRSSAEASETTPRSSIVDASPDSVSNEAADVEQEGTTKPPKSSKAMKKPDEILPCPRCNSTNTKFCYYNNYNVNQPRHFCRLCQRYWTAGGNMRTMSVGAGRRKNKSTSSHYRHISISEALQGVETDAAANDTSPPGLKYHDGTVLNFGGIVPPILDSTVSILNGTNTKALNGLTGRFCGPKSGKRHLTNLNGEDWDNCSGDSTVSAFSSNNEGAANMNFYPQIPGIPGIPMPYPWNYPALLQPSTQCPAGFSTLFYQPTFLNYGFLSNWNLPLLVPCHGVPDSPTGELHDSDNPMKRRNVSVLVPKTLRVDDPKEAAKSTIWSTLGIEKDSLYGAGKISPALVSNPPSLSRSVSFVESSLT